MGVGRRAVRAKKNETLGVCTRPGSANLLHPGKPWRSGTPTNPDARPQVPGYRTMTGRRSDPLSRTTTTAYQPVGMPDKGTATRSAPDPSTIATSTPRTS